MRRSPLNDVLRALQGHNGAFSGVLPPGTLLIPSGNHRPHVFRTALEVGCSATTRSDLVAAPPRRDTELLLDPERRTALLNPDHSDKYLPAVIARFAISIRVDAYTSAAICCREACRLGWGWNYGRRHGEGSLAKGPPEIFKGDPRLETF